MTDETRSRFVRSRTTAGRQTTREDQPPRVCEYYRRRVGCLVASVTVRAWLLQRRGPVQHDFVWRCARARDFRHGYQEAVAVSRDVEELDVARYLEQGRWRAGDAESRLGLDRHRHDGPIGREIEQLLTVRSPNCP